MNKHDIHMLWAKLQQKSQLLQQFFQGASMPWFARRDLKPNDVVTKAI
jgi:hypothetical protein